MEEDGSDESENGSLAEKAKKYMHTYIHIIYNM